MHREIENTSKEHDDAIRDAGEASDEKHKEIAGIIAGAIKTIGSEVPEYEKTQREKEYKLQRRTYLATLAAGIAAAIYAAFAYLTLTEIQDQTYASCVSAQTAQQAFLQGQQAAIDSHEASIAAYAQAIAVIENQKAFVSPQFIVPPDRPYGKPLELRFSIANTGKSDASNVSITGVAIAARPNSNPKIPIKSGFGVEKDVLEVGERFMPDSYPTYTTPPRSIRIPVLDETGKPITDTAEIDKEIFSQRKKYIFIYYKISYEDFANHYTRTVCVAQISWQDSDAKPLEPKDIDRQCNDGSYNTKTEIPKIPMPPPAKPIIPIPAGKPLTCETPKKTLLDFWR
ncbi:MAG TPA: hypothetical protein VK574_10585 [Terracidiphilus sp.]|nr:hypothetical protein [Terracidiphilus sp.]